MHPTNPEAVKVKRDNERGYSWVYPFDPAVHVRFEDDAKPAPKPRAKKDIGK